eukprot:COSAG06_NODE_1471_length_9351_cov_18.052637_4_plen_47_part_00
MNIIYSGVIVDVKEEQSTLNLACSYVLVQVSPRAVATPCALPYCLV